MKQARAKPNRNRTNLLVDITIFLGFLLALAPHFTGDPIHEWLGVSLGAGVMTHLLLHWKWIIEVTRRFLQSTQWSARINYVLNVVLFFDVSVIIFSGLMFSEHLAALVGLQNVHDNLWKTLHADAARLFLYLMGLHVALHWQWVVNMITRFLPPFRRSRTPTAAALPDQHEV